MEKDFSNLRKTVKKATATKIISQTAQNFLEKIKKSFKHDEVVKKKTQGLSKRIFCTIAKILNVYLFLHHGN